MNDPICRTEVTRELSATRYVELARWTGSDLPNWEGSVRPGLDNFGAELPHIGAVVYQVAFMRGRDLLSFGKVPNDDLVKRISERNFHGQLAMEMVASYGMAVGRTVFETCT